MPAPHIVMPVPHIVMAVPHIVMAAPHIVMAGLVPAIHVPPPTRPLRAHTAMPQDVGTRNKSGHDDGGSRGRAGNLNRTAMGLSRPVPVVTAGMSRH